MKIVETELWHLKYLEDRYPETGFGSLDKACLTSIAYTGFIDEEPIGMAGIMTMWPGVGEAWALITDQARGQALSMHRAVYRIMNDSNTWDEFHRVQCVVLVGDSKALHWAEHLGFKAEGLLSDYDSNKVSYIRMARLRNGCSI